MICGGVAALTSVACAVESIGSVGARGKAPRFVVPGRLTECSTTVGASRARRAVRDNPAIAAIAERDAQLVIRAKSSRRPGVCVSLMKTLTAAIKRVKCTIEYQMRGVRMRGEGSEFRMSWTFKNDSIPRLVHLQWR